MHYITEILTNDTFILIILSTKHRSMSINTSLILANVQPDEQLAVMVYFHGGTFITGSGDDDSYGPDFIIEKRTILVTLNYRLGIFGFITFNTPEYSGNMALKDQQLALKWIHENIAQFSGDPKRVTLFGQSSGASCAHYQILSRESRKYFRNEILLSNSFENRGTLSNSTALLNYAYTIAKELKSPQESLDGLIEFFKTAPAEQLVNFINDPSYEAEGPSTIYAPVIESLLNILDRDKFYIWNIDDFFTNLETDAIRPFITENPSELFKKSYIDIDIIFTLSPLVHATFYSL